MKIVDELVEQCREPKGWLGTFMIKIMNTMDAGLTKWALSNINCFEGKLLDIGCGGGKTVHLLAKRYPKAQIYAIDYSETAVKTTIKRNRRKVDDGSVIVSRVSVSSMPFEDNFFDVIIAFRAHYFWPDLKQDIKEVFRVLNKNGKLLILSELYKINYHMKQYNTNAAFLQLLKDTGFNSVDIYERKGCNCVIAEK